jgi:hypothetical protein
MDKAELSLQADLFTRYLVNHPANDLMQSIFAKLASANFAALSSKDDKFLKFALKHSWSIPYIDAYLVIFEPDSELRRRIYIAFAVLECIPAYASYFLPQERPPLYIVVIFLKGIRAIFRLAVGIILTRVIA